MDRDDTPKRVIYTQEEMARISQEEIDGIREEVDRALVGPDIITHEFPSIESLLELSQDVQNNFIDLKMQVDKAIENPDFSIITDYPLKWEEVEIIHKITLPEKQENSINLYADINWKEV